MKFKTREEWLVAAVEQLRERFAKTCGAIPKKLRVSCGLPSNKAFGKHRAVGEAWSSQASKDESNEIFISPTIDDQIEVLETLVHELVHVTIGIECGHRKKFGEAAKRIGLMKPWRATKAGPDLKAALEAMAKDLGPYPHASLDNLTNFKKKQKARMIKIQCPGCGYLMRSSRKWLEKTKPTCQNPVCRFYMKVIWPELQPEDDKTQERPPGTQIDEARDLSGGKASREGSDQGGADGASSAIEFADGDAKPAALETTDVGAVTPTSTGAAPTDSPARPGGGKDGVQEGAGGADKNVNKPKNAEEGSSTDGGEAAPRDGRDVDGREASDGLRQEPQGAADVPSWRELIGNVPLVDENGGMTGRGDADADSDSTKARKRWATLAQALVTRAYEKAGERPPSMPAAVLENLGELLENVVEDKGAGERRVSPDVAVQVTEATTAATT